MSIADNFLVILSLLGQSLESLPAVSDFLDVLLSLQTPLEYLMCSQPGPRHKTFIAGATSPLPWWIHVVRGDEN